MCSRFVLKADQEELSKHYPNALPVSFESNFNIAPTEEALVITAQEPDKMQKMHFGLMPFRPNNKKAYGMLHAVSEEIMEKPTYNRLLINHKTCLVLANGFYEFKKVGKASEPYYFSLKDRNIFAFAGLWTTLKIFETGEEYDSFTILTTESNNIVGEIHDKKRMAVILDKSSEEIWLNKQISPNEALKICNKYPDELMNRWPVSKAVNFVVNKFEKLIDPIDAPALLF